MKTHYEQGKWYAIIYLPNGHTYYSGPFKCHSTAYRHAIKETKKHTWAAKNHMLYNTRGC